MEADSDVVREIRSIAHGVVFLHAPWSMPSVIAFRSLQRAITEAGLSQSTLRIVDVDENPAIYEMPELEGKIHGWGEAFIVRDGQIQGFRVLGRSRKQQEEVSAEVARLLSGFRDEPPPQM